MAQYARPNADLVPDRWRLRPLYEKLNEVVRDDATYITSPPNPSTPGDDVEVGLSPLQTPGSRKGHILRYTFKKNAAGGRTLNLTVELRQIATVIASWAHLNITGAWTQADQALTEAQAGQITDYAALSVRYRASTMGAGPARSCQWSWCKLQVPAVKRLLTLKGRGGDSRSRFRFRYRP